VKAGEGKAADRPGPIWLGVLLRSWFPGVPRLAEH
jgi:hypothetical protein